MLFTRLVVAVSLLFAQTAIAASTYWYNFGFDFRNDGQHVEALDYELLSGKEVVLRMPQTFIDVGRAVKVRGEGGYFPPGTALYFKWRDTQSGKVYEETARFDGLLSGDLQYCSLTLLILDNHLHVFLVRQETRPSSMAPAGPAIYRPLKVYEVYPARQS